MFGHTAGDFGPCQGSWAVPFSHVAGSRGRHMVAGRGQQKDPKRNLAIKDSFWAFSKLIPGQGCFRYRCKHVYIMFRESTIVKSSALCRGQLMLCVSGGLHP